MINKTDETVTGSVYDHRIFYPTLSDDQKLKNLIKWLKQVPVYSLMMFNASFDIDPAILSLEEHKKRAERLSIIIPKISEIDIIPAVNALTTMGHGNKKASIKEEFGFQPITGSDGIEIDGAVCALDENFLKYVFEMYRLYAQTGAAHIWTDDDIRINNHRQKSNYCFCPLHLDELSEKTGQRWDLKNLVRTLSDPHEKDIYEIWNEINTDALVNLFKQIERAVHDFNPDIRIGLMTCGCNSSRDIDREIEALRGKGADPLLRPGGGYWQDYDLLGALRKRILIRSESPFKEIDFNSSYELENHPYRPNLKSLKAMEFEMDLAILDGTDRIALNIFDNVGSPIDVKGNYKRLLNERHEFLLSLRREVREKKACGVNIIRNQDYSQNAEFRKWSENLSRLGIPSVSRTAGSPTILCGRICETMDNTILSRIVENGAIIDGNALIDLIERNILDKREIVNTNEEIDTKDIACEIFSNHPANSSFAGEKRQVNSINVFKHLEIMNKEKFFVLSELMSVGGNIISPSLILYNSRFPCLIFPYSVNEITLLTTERARQIGYFLSSLPEYQGVRIKEMNCCPILYRGDNSIILGISRLSLDPVDKFSIWLSSSLGVPQTMVQMLNNTGKWEEIDFQLEKDISLQSGICLKILRSCESMSMNVFRWNVA